MRRLRSAVENGAVAEEAGSIGASLLLGIVGFVVGVSLGLTVAALLFKVQCPEPVPGAPADLGRRCGEMAPLFWLLVSVPTGGLVGAVTGLVIGARRPRAPGAAGAIDPTRRREAPAAAWTTVAAGIAAAFGAWAGWRAVTIQPDALDRYVDVMTPGPESAGFVAGVLILTAGVLRVLRPEAPAPATLLAVGCALAALAPVAAVVDLVLTVPDELPWRLLPGSWYSAIGAALGIVALALDRRHLRRRSDASAGG